MSQQWMLLGTRARRMLPFVAALVAVQAVVASGAAGGRSDVTTVTLVARAAHAPALSAAIARFEVLHPDIVIKASYPATAVLSSSILVSAGAIGTAIAASTVYPSSPNWSARRNTGEVSFAGTPGWRQALQMLGDMQAARCFEPSPATVNAGTAYSAFDSGQAAMMVAGGWDLILNVQQANPSLDVGFFPLPGATLKRTRVMVSPGEYLTVNSASPVKQQALQFLDFVASAWPAVAIATTEDTISTLDLIKGVVPKSMAAFAPFIKRQEFVLSPLIYDNNPRGVAAFRAGITSLLAGTSTVDQVLANVDAAW